MGNAGNRSPGTKSGKVSCVPQEGPDVLELRDSSGPELQGKARLSPELCICNLILKSSFL